jgi:hypothetical protein
MYKILRKPFGYRLTFTEIVNAEQMTEWAQESAKALATAPAKFGVFVEMQGLKPLSAEAQAVLIEGQKLYKAKGMQRSVVILQYPITKLQLTRLAKESGIYEWERYLSTEENPNWETLALAWIDQGIDPDKVAVRHKS